jgi:hypothetical protein
MVEVMLPSLRGYFTKIPTSISTHPGRDKDPSKVERFVCNLRISSDRFPKYLDLLVELDQDAQSLDRRPDFDRFIQLARDIASDDEHPASGKQKREGQ